MTSVFSFTLCLTSLAAAESSVTEAALQGDRERVRALLRGGADVNAAQGDGMTALHWAALHGDLEMAEMLIYAGANLKAATRLGPYTPLLLAAKDGNPEMIEKLVEAGADMTTSTATGTTPLMLAAASGSARAVSTLIDLGSDPNAVEGVRGQSALMFAAANNRAEAIRTLLERGADPTLASTVFDVAALSEESSKAGRERGKRMAEAKKAADEEARARAEKLTRKSPAQEAEDSEQALKKKASKKAKKKAPAPQAAKKNGDGKSPFGRLFSWFGFGKTKAPEPRPQRLSLAQLVGHQGGMTPLLHAAREGHLEAVKVLLEGGADVNQLSAGDQTSPLLIATINGRFDTAMYLLSQGADPNLANSAGAAPLYAAVNVEWAPHAFYPQPITRHARASYLGLMEALLERGADPNRRLIKKVWFTGYNFDQSGVDEVGATAFWRAAQSSDVAAMRLLVSAGADAAIPTIVRLATSDPSGQTAGENKLEDVEETDVAELGEPAVSPLQVATGAGYDGNYHRNSPNGWLTAVQFLVDEMGADVNAADHEGYTPLHNAAARGDNEMIQFLVSRGADVTAVSKKGQTVADMANGPIQRIQPFPETLALLMELGSKNSNKCVSC